MFFTILIRHKTDGTYINNVYSYETQAQAYHQFNWIMSTYSNNDEYDYIASFVLRNGTIMKSDFIDKRQNAEENNNTFFVIRILKNVNGTYSNEVFSYAEELPAYHQFYLIMSTYDTNDNYDYVASILMKNTSLKKTDFVDKRQNSAEE